jgi:murein DD-endopeptidase MepM/ murein hydrolase activator NlpD
VNKGKVKNQKRKYFSLVFVPHSSNKPRTFKFRSFYGGFFSVLLLVAALLISSVILLASTVHENNQLKKNINELYSANTEQRKLLNEKTQELAQKDQQQEEYTSSIDARMKEFSEKFNEITDKYITSSKTSRSGERNDKTFSDELGDLKEILDGINELNSRSGSTEIDLSESEEKLAAFFDSVPTLMPASGRISDTFGYRRDPFTGRKKYHEGLDIAADYGDSIKAAASGTVTLAERYSGYGRAVIIDHGRGITTLYGHASQLLVKEGQKVEKGDIIAKVGSSGRSTGPHLHYEVMVYGTPVDPMQYID